MVATSNPSETDLNRLLADAEPDAIRVWRRLHRARPDLLGVYSAFYKKQPNGKGELVNWAERYCRPDQLEEGAAWVSQQDRNGRECYFSVAQLLNPDRHKDNAAPTYVVHADLDGCPLDACPMRPTIVIETSPDRYHAYWVGTRLLQPAKAEELNRRLARAMGADKAATDAVRLLRVPGTRSRKRAGVTDVKLLWIDDQDADLDTLDRVLPPEPKMPTAVGISTPIAGDDEQVLEGLLESSPRFARVWQGDIAEYPGESEADWVVARELVTACGGDADRAESIMRRCDALARDKWDDRRGNETYLAYTIRRAAERPFQNATPYRSEDPSTWPELVTDVPGGPSNGTCSEHCRVLHAPREQALRRQAQLVNELIQCDLSPVFKLTLLRLVALVGFAQSHGQTTFRTSAKRIADSIGLSAQSVRAVLHSLARNDRDELKNERGVIDLDTTRVPEAGEYCSVFDVTPLTDGGYTGFLEAVVAYAPQMAAPPKRARRHRQSEVRPPNDVLDIPTCQGAGGDHLMDSRAIVCARCGDELNEERRFVRVQNATRHRSEAPPLTVDISGATPHRFEQSTADLERLLRLYERAGTS